jgi:hypothetical protein
MLLAKTISPEDTSLFFVTDSVEDAVTYIHQNSIHRFKLAYEKPYKPFSWLFEND